MMTKPKKVKQSVVEEEVSFSLGNIQNAAKDFSKKVKPKKKATPKQKTSVFRAKRPLTKKATKQALDLKPILFVIHKDEAKKFNTHFYKFLEKTGSYELASKALFFSACVKFMHNDFGVKEKAPSNFISYVSRKGKRPISKRTVPVSELERMYLKISSVDYNNYMALMHHYLKGKGELMNPSYSASYFFYDFMDMVTERFDAIVKAH